MKNKSLATLGTLALLAAGTAFGQEMGTFDVPFEFSLANKVMPAGHYSVSQSSAHFGLLLVDCRECGVSAISPTINTGGGTNENIQARLVFSKYGDKYFLAEAWLSPGSPFGAAVAKSRTEREIARVTPQVARIAIPLRTGVAALAALR